GVISDDSQVEHFGWLFGPRTPARLFLEEVRHLCHAVIESNVGQIGTGVLPNAGVHDNIILPFLRGEGNVPHIAEKADLRLIGAREQEEAEQGSRATDHYARSFISLEFEVSLSQSR